MATAPQEPGILNVSFTRGDAFLPPCPGDGYVLDESTFSWVPT